MRPLALLFVLTLLGTTGRAATLPGFSVETLATGEGFVSSVATDSQGTIYFTTTDGWIHRVDGNASTKVASLPTRSGGNGGLLGMAMLDDDTAVVHYTTWNGDEGDLAKVLDDVVSRVDLVTGAESVLHTFVCDIESRRNGASSEHHGGNLTVASDGAIYLGIGDYGTQIIAQKPEWNAGKIWRVDSVTGVATQWARGMRNPYDLAWDPELGRVIVAENGPNGGDEIHIVAKGENCGWPHTYGNEPAYDGAVAPVYVFENTVAPTGFLRLAPGANSMLRRGYLAGAFVTKAIYYFPTFERAIPLLEDYDEYVIDVAQAPNGDIIFATAGWTGSAIHRLRVPPRGDCNGDGLTDGRDISAMVREIGDGGRHSMVTAQDGDYAGSWGCDANADGVIDEADLEKLLTMVSPRRRAVRK